MSKTRKRHQAARLIGRLLSLWLATFSSWSGAEQSDFAVNQPEVSGRLHLPSTVPAPAVVVIGGSGGRLNQVFPALLADQGYVVLSLAYFNAPGLPATLDEVPVETVSRALNFLRLRPEVDQAAGFGVLGVSRGSELAMLAAIYDQRIRAVAGVVPSSVAWHGQTSPVAWTIGGEAVPALTFPRRSALSYLQRAEQALLTEQAGQARLAIERINGPVLLVSASRDHIWPSTRMSGDLVKRAARLGISNQVQHLDLDDDHGLDAASVERLKQPLMELFAVLKETG